MSDAYFKGYRDFKINEQKTVSEIFDFCSKRPRIDFCSEASLQSMFKVLEHQRKEYRKSSEQIEKTRLETSAKKVKQQKLKNFFDKNPKYKFMTEFETSRFF
jgi:hypothetical protein